MAKNETRTIAEQNGVAPPAGDQTKKERKAMERLPVKFEQSILKKHGIEWNGKRYIGLHQMLLVDVELEIDLYAIAAIGIKAVLDMRWDLELIKVNAGYTTIQYGSCCPDFCETIFKAIREVWK